MRETWNSAETYAYTDNPARQLAASPLVLVIVLLLSQMVLVLAMQQSWIISTAHALLVGMLGLYFLIRDETPERMLYVAAYIVGAELIWRGTNARVFWEYGKYGVTILLLASLIKEHRLLRIPKTPLIFFVLLIPSIAVMASFDREQIAFNLSGPLLLAVAVMYFSGLKLEVQQYRRLLLAALAPIVGLAFLANFTILTTETLIIAVGGKATSAGIGPNQVSSIFGLGIFLAFALALLFDQHRGLRWLMILIVIWLTGQAALTLSRGGLWTGLGAVSVAVLFLAIGRKIPAWLVVATLIAMVLFNFVALPTLDNFTGGIVTERLQDFDLTGRGDIMLADLLIFRDNLYFGVGPGQSYALHALTFRTSNTHTEYTRLLSEHGILGAVALVLMLSMAVRVILRAPRGVAQALAAASVAYALLFMFHAAMRLSAPAYMFGVAAITIVFQLSPNDHGGGGDLQLSQHAYIDSNDGMADRRAS